MNHKDTCRALVPKMESLVHKHRRRVFDEGAAGDRHHRALCRLKRTATWRRMMQDRRDAADYRRSEALLRAYA